MSVITYAGIFDDSVDRYPWWSVRTDEQYINQQLMHNFIYDRKPLINDGYLITHPVLRKQIIEYDTSLAGSLFRSGNLILYHRGADSLDIAGGLESTAKASGIRSHLDIIESGEWDQLGPAINALGKHAGVVKRCWPGRNIGEAFYRLMERVLDSGEAEIGLRYSSKCEFERVLQNYLMRNGNDTNYTGARGLWTESAIDTVCEKSGAHGYMKRRQELMQIANECYHLAHGVCIQQDEARQEQNQVAVLTGQSGMFNDLIVPDNLVDLENIYRAGYLLIAMPETFNLKDCTRLIGLAEIREFHQLRSTYINQLNTFISAEGFDDSQFKAADEAATAYQEFLVEQLGAGVILGRNYADRAIIETTKAVLCSPLQHVLMVMSICGINLEDVIYRRIAVNELRRKGIQLQCRAEVADCVRDLGLMQPILNGNKVNEI